VRGECHGGSTAWLVAWGWSATTAWLVAWGWSATGYLDETDLRSLRQSSLLGWCAIQLK
jgi:hypothetical protein